MIFKDRCVSELNYTGLFKNYKEISYMRIEHFTYYVNIRQIDRPPVSLPHCSSYSRPQTHFYLSRAPREGVSHLMDQ